MSKPDGHSDPKEMSKGHPSSPANIKKTTFNTEPNTDSIHSNGDLNGKNNTDKTEKVVQQPRLGAPPDGGWGWVVALSSFSISLLVDGVCFSFGIFFDDFRTEFKASKATTSWIGSVLNGSYLIFGPIVGALVNIYGCRRIAMCGSVLSCVAFFCSAYSKNIGVLIFTFGFVGGIGFGLMYLPAIVIVGYYFERRRALATGIACCGSGMGAFLFAPFSEYLLKTYGWRGATWIISGLVLNGFMFALFYRPLPGPTFEQVISEVIEPSQSDTLLIDNELEADISLNEEEHSETPRMSHESSRRSHEVNPKTVTSEVLKKVKEDVLMPSTGGLYRTRSVNLYGPEKPKDKDTSFKDTDILRLTRSQDFAPIYRGLSGSKQEIRHRKPEPMRMDLPHLQRKDVFYSGSIWHLKEYRELGSIEGFRDKMITPTASKIGTGTPTPAISRHDITTSQHATSTVTVTVSKPSMREAIGSIFDIHLLKSPTFLVYGLSCFLCMAGFFVPFTYMPDHAIGLGLDTQSAAFLISIIGITNTVGRVAVGFISDQPWADCLLLNNVALMVGGLATIFVPYYGDYYVLAIYSAVFGTAIAVFVSLRSIIMVELLGLEKLTTAFGFVIMFQGLSSLVGSPIAGALSDATGNYNAAFYMAGITLFLSGVVCIPLKYVARWENRRSEHRKLQDLAKDHKGNDGDDEKGDNNIDDRNENGDNVNNMNRDKSDDKVDDRVNNKFVDNNNRSTRCAYKKVADGDSNEDDNNDDDVREDENVKLM